MTLIREGDTIYFRRLGKSTLDQARVIEIAPASPYPLLFLNTGETIPAWPEITVLSPQQI